MLFKPAVPTHIVQILDVLIMSAMIILLRGDRCWLRTRISPLRMNTITSTMITLNTTNNKRPGVMTGNIDPFLLFTNLEITRISAQRLSPLADKCRIVV